MKRPIYSVYDRVAETYTSLSEFRNDNVAKRTFLEACQQVDGYKQHPNDMEIHRIGYFNDETGTFEPDKEIIEKGYKNEV